VSIEETERRTLVISAFCPDCDGEIDFNPAPSLGDILVCPHCDADLEVISVDPIELDWAFLWSGEDMEDVDDEDEW
jgi:lysine biosynthesis protein LysW